MGDTIYEGVIESAIALNLAIKQDFEDTGGGALVCEKPGGSIDHDHVCPTGNEHDPTLDDGHIITIRVADAATDREFEENCLSDALACVFPDDEFEGEEGDRFIGDRTMLITMGQGHQFEDYPRLSSVAWTNDPDYHGEELPGGGTGFYIDKLLIHELGHAAGLAHTPQSTDSIMRESYQEDILSVKLHDTTAISKIYFGHSPHD